MSIKALSKNAFCLFCISGCWKPNHGAIEFYAVFLEVYRRGAKLVKQCTCQPFLHGFHYCSPSDLPVVSSSKRT